MNCINGLLSVTTVAAIAINHPFATIANTALEIAQIKIPTAVQVDSPLGSHYLAGIEPGNLDTKHLCEKRNFLVSQEKDPPRPCPPGGSR